MKPIRAKLEDLFKNACLFGVSLPSLCEAAGYDEQQVRSSVGQCIVSPKCRHCDDVVEPEQFAMWNTYWKSMLAPCHKACREVGMKQEAFDCQSIDADCNDCRHFVRDVGTKAKGVIPGRCSKYDRPTVGMPNFCSGWPCFEHRRGEKN